MVGILDQEIAQSIPGAELEILPTVHLPNVELPERYGRRVVKFLLQA